MGKRYWCVSLSFVYRSTDIVSPISLDLVSRNTCCPFEISAVDFMLGWKLLASSRKVVKVSRLCDHFMSSIGRHYGHAIRRVHSAALYYFHVNVVNEP